MATPLNTAEWTSGDATPTGTGIVTIYPLQHKGNKTPPKGLALCAATGRYASGSRGSIQGRGSQMEKFRFCGKELRPDRNTPLGKKTRLYSVLECGYCKGQVLVLADKEMQQRPRRVYEHLQRCDGYLPSPMPPPQKRKVNRDVGQYTQLNFRRDGSLEKHPLGSLLPGRSAPRKPVCLPFLALAL